MNSRRTWFLLFTLVMLVGAFVFLNAVHEILLPFIVGLLLAYLLNPVVMWLERFGLSRPLASTIPVSTAVVLIVLLLVLGVPLLMDQLGSFAQRLPVYLMTLEHFVIPAKLAKSFHLQFTLDSLLRPLGMIGAQGAEWTVQALQKTLSGVAWLVNIALLVVMTPLVAFYMLMDWPSMMSNTLLQLPKRWRKTTQEIARDIDFKMAAYLRGTVAVCLSMGVFYAVSLSGLGWMSTQIAGVKIAPMELGWAIGLATGLLSFLPVIGASLGVMMMLLVAVMQYQLQVWEPYALLAAIFVLGQTLEGYVLSPLLVGNRVGLHPLWVIFALLAGGALSGITGMLVAIPVTVIISVILPRILAVWREALD